MTITLDATTVSTLNPDGTSFNDINYTGATRLEDNSIGEYKMLALEFTIDQVVDTDYYFIPALFVPSSFVYSVGYKPSNGYQFRVTGTAPSGEQDMSLYVASGSTPPKAKNWKATIEFTSATEFTIRFYFYQVWDEESYLAATYQDNHSKFLKSDRFDSSELNASGKATSVYVDSKSQIQYYLYCSRNDGSKNTGFTIKGIDYSAKWYQKNTFDAAPYFINPEFNLFRSAAPVSNLSPVADTQIQFRIESPGDVVDKILLWLIRIDSSDNTIDFVDNYEASFIDVVTTGGSSTIDNKLKAPATGSALVTGKYQCDVFTDKTKLTYGEKYRFIAVAYSTSGTWRVNSFISDEFVVSDQPNYAGNGFDVTATIGDVDNDYSGNDLECVVEERMRTKIVLDFASNKWADDILARLGLTVTNDIRRYLTEVIVDVYEETTSGSTTTKHVFAYPTRTKTSPTTYSTASGITLDFSIADQATFIYEFRNRYESHLSNLYTYVNGVLLPSPTSNMNWATRTINMEWNLKFFYDDYTTPFTDIVKIKHKVRPKGYETGALVIEPDGGLQQGESFPDFFCADEDLCFEAKVISNPGYKLITNIEINPGNAGTIQEHEVWDPYILSKITNNKILSQEENFGETESNKANFCLNSLNLLVDTPYKLSAIAKESNTDEIQTETSIDIFTEADNTIITE